MKYQGLFWILTIISFVVFFASCWRRFSLLTIGKPADRISHFGERIGQMLWYAFVQRRVVGRPFGFNHLALFWSFLVLVLANLEFLVQGLFPSISLKLLPAPLYHLLALAFDLGSLVALAAVALAVSRRLFFPPAYIEARSRDAFVILGLIAVLMLAFFGLNACEIAGNPADPAARFRPISRLLSAPFANTQHATLEAWIMAFWWIHAVALLAFFNYLPFSKHMHVITAIPNCFMRSLVPVNTLPREEFKKGNTFGVGKLDGFTWKDLFDSYSCTECGRCQDVCPATNTRKPLNPRMIIHHLKANLLANGPAMKDGRAPQLPLIGHDAEGTITEEAIWACTSCGACMEVCPVFIEQMPKILLMRRHLVETQAKIPDELIAFFENSEQRSNPWGIAPSDRAKWQTNLAVKPFEQGMEYLFYVGCAGSFDSRGKHVTVAIARILDAAGLSWGILGKDEKCCGDSLRRLGNEYVFDRMARENVELFKARGVRKVITLCPHCFTTLKNDYRQFGLELEVVHHTQLIQDLLASGRLRINPSDTAGRLVFHDSCYLARHNDVVEQPRQILTAATGHAPTELPRNRRNSFCCGAGGGRMWMEEEADSRINIERAKEALDAGAQTLCVSCPYCLTMMEDGLKDLNAHDRVQLKDIAEIVADRLPQQHS